jgi:hypothetical protein
MFVSRMDSGGDSNLPGRKSPLVASDHVEGEVVSDFQPEDTAVRDQIAEAK